MQYCIIDEKTVLLLSVFSLTFFTFHKFVFHVAVRKCKWRMFY